jgi:hypothetical protein
LIKRLPFRRGFGNSSQKAKPIVLSAARLASLGANRSVSREDVVAAGLVPASWRGRIKVVGLTGKEKLTFDGIEVTKKLSE